MKLKQFFFIKVDRFRIFPFLRYSPVEVRHQN